MATRPRRSARQPATEERVQLDIHPSVVFKLGEDLISDDVQALMELIKNSWDADATNVKVTIDTSAVSDASGSAPGAGDLIGVITVTDNGDGMSEDDLINGWLVVSNNKKKTFKAEGRTTAKHRTPLGDKGLGRLGVQRLGQVTQIVTTARDSDMTLSLEIPWYLYGLAGKLADIPLTLKREAAARPHGTQIVIRGLNEPAAFRGDKELDRLQREFAWLLSPYAGRRNYRVDIEIDGRTLELGGDAYDLKKLVQIHYELDYREERLDIVGLLRLDFFSTGRRGEIDAKEAYETLLAADHGRAFAEWFFKEKENYVSRWSLKLESDGPWFLSFSHTKALADIDHVKYVSPDQQGASHATTLRIADPGPFRGEIGAFAVDDEDQLPADNPLSYLRAIAGVHLYRDGFGIRMGDDWLGLGKRWTSGTSFYNLRPRNVLGHIDLTAAKNSQLEEMTDREGLKRSPYVDNFRALMEEWRSFTEEVQGNLRRGYNEWRNAIAAARTPEPELTREPTPEAISAALTRRLAARNEGVGRIEKSTNAMSTALTRVRQSLTKQPVEVRRAADRDLDRLAKQLDALQTMVDEFRGATSEDEALSKALKSQLEQLDDQLAMMHEAIALGLSAEALTHEVAQSTARLIERGRQTQTQLKALGPIPPTMTRYLSEVRSTATGLNRQLTHFLPALRFARENREPVAVADFARAVESYYNDRWESDPVGLRVRVSVRQDFTILINRGRLTQVFDNLILNSDYWVRSVRDESGNVVRRDLDGLPPDADISIDVDRPRVRFSDTGPGVEPSFEGILFDPFVTAKRDADGRGLGLYVVRRLLEPEHSTIQLLPNRNAIGRRATFELDFTGCLVAGGDK
jgi:signal transduction histidine kinase